MTTGRTAYFTDTHLGQKLVMGGGLAGDKMRYDNEPAEHQSNLRLVLDDVARKGISEVTFGGDIGTAQSVAGFFELLARYGFATSVILGNHDTFAEVGKYWPDGAGGIDGKMCYARSAGDLKQVFLDTSDNSVGPAQLAWLARELEPACRVVLFIHHPVLDVHTPIERAGAALRDREQLMALLTASACEIDVFCGHYHMDDERSEANVRQFGLARIPEAHGQHFMALVQQTQRTLPARRTDKIGEDEHQRTPFDGVQRPFEQRRQVGKRCAWQRRLFN